MDRLLDDRPAQLNFLSLIAIVRSEEHTSELQSHVNLVCRLLLEKKKNRHPTFTPNHLIASNSARGRFFCSALSAQSLCLATNDPPRSRTSRPAITFSLSRRRFTH